MNETIFYKEEYKEFDRYEPVASVLLYYELNDRITITLKNDAIK
jgi:hypothetical protein